MKKLLFVLLILVVIAGSAFSADLLKFPPPVKGGNVMIDAGLGYYRGGWGFGEFGIPPLFVQAEFALPVGVPISVGAGVSFFTYEWANFFTMTFITPQARANWHWNLPVSWLDLYTGLGLGWDIVSVEYKGLSRASGAASSGLYFGLQVGAHFYFTRNIGAMVEFGWPYLIKGGVAFKF